MVIINKKTITIEEIKNNINLDLSERIVAYSKYKNLNPEALEELAIATIKQEYEFWINNRTNISERTNRLLQSILDGHVLNKLEAFEMLCDDPKQVEQYAKYETFKENVNNNNGVTLKDFEDLCNTMGWDLQTIEIIQTEFERKGLIIDEYKEKENKL